MKFTIKNIKVEGNEWIKIQNESLKFLESQKQKVNQQAILDFASNGYVQVSVNNEFHALSQKINDFEFYFRPIVLNKTIDITKLSFDLKSYYLDKEDVKDFKSDAYKLLPFNLRPNYQLEIADFIEKYVSNFKFKRAKNDGEVIEHLELALLEIKDLKNETQPQKLELVASKEVPQENLEYLLLDKKKGEIFVFEPNKEFKLEITILDTFKFVSEPITDLNASQIGIADLKTLKDVKNYIHESLMQQIISEALFEYGFRVIDAIRQSNTEIELPEELIQSDIEGFNFAPDFEGNKYEIVKNSILNYFWFNYVAKTFDMSITNDELDYEIKRVQSFMNVPNQSQIDVRRAADAVLMKKLAYKLLKEQNNTFIKTFKKYILFKEQKQ